MRLLCFFSTICAALWGFVFAFCAVFVLFGGRIDSLTTLQDLELMLRRSSQFWYMPYLLNISGLLMIWFTVLAFGSFLAFSAQAGQEALRRRSAGSQQPALPRSIYD